MFRKIYFAVLIFTLLATTIFAQNQTPCLEESFDFTPVLPAYYRNGPVSNADNTPANNAITDAGAALGRVLFYDTRLSQNFEVSCASCHQQEFAFTDPDVLSAGFEGGLTGRHSMSLVNARYYERGRFFWDERAVTLEEQVLQPIQDEVEMGMTLPDVIDRLEATTFYAPLFEAAFGDGAITENRMALAMAQFVRSMVSYESKYDQAFVNRPPNDPDFEGTFTQEELLGLQLFGGQNVDAQGRNLGCNRCHGTPAFISDDLENNGLDANTNADQGAGNGNFKAHSLRNIAVTAPYMHDGRFETLEEVIDFYSTGIQNHPNLSNELRTRDGNPRRFNITNTEKAALVAFFNTLTDDNFLSDPKFSDPFCDAGTVLAVEFLDFSGESIDCQNVLKWTAANEDQVDFYVLESSTDGVNFEAQERFVADNTQAYYFKNDNRASSTFYRIQSVEKSGQVTFSPTIVVSSDCQQREQVYPNPVSEVLFYDFYLPEAAKVSIQVLDVSGQLILQKEINASKDLNTISLPLHDVAQGIYFIKFNLSSKMLKFIKV